jgi:hypothetical protein
MKYNICMSTKIEAPQTNKEASPILPQTPAEAVSQFLPAIMSVHHTLSINNALQRLDNIPGITDAEYNERMKAVLKEKPIAGQEFISAELEQYSAETEQAIAVIDKRLEEIGEEASAELKLQHNMRKNVLINSLSKAKKQSEIAINQLQTNFPSTKVTQDLISTPKPSVIDKVNIPVLPLDSELPVDPHTGHSPAIYIHDSSVYQPKTDATSIYEKTKITQPEGTTHRTQKPKAKIGLNVRSIISNWGKKKVQPNELNLHYSNVEVQPSNGLTQEQNATLTDLNTGVSDIARQIQSPATTDQKLKALSDDTDRVLNQLKQAQKPESKVKAAAKGALSGFEKLRYGAVLTPEIIKLKASIKSQETVIYNLTRQSDQADRAAKSAGKFGNNDTLKDKANQLYLQLEKLKMQLREDKIQLNYSISDHRDRAKDPNAFGDLTKDQLELNYKAAKAILDSELAKLIAADAISVRVNNSTLIKKKREQIASLISKHNNDLRNAPSD